MGRMKELGLVGSIRFQSNDEIIKCIVRGLSEDYTTASIFSGDRRICFDGSIELMIFSPLESSPIRFNGRIACDLGDHEYEGIYLGKRGYFVNVYITHIGRLEQRRLRVLIAQKRAFFSSGR